MTNIITISIDTELLKRLDNLVKAVSEKNDKKITRSEIIRKILREHMHKEVK
jgi:metal-responsive CopG/Arc/MetJ family transcriptional regulator